MSENGKCFTFIWKIKNFSFHFRKLNMHSPKFTVQGMHDIEFKLLFCCNFGNYFDHFACYLCGELKDSSLTKHEIHYELSFLAVDGSVLQSQKFFNRRIEKSFNQRVSGLVAKRTEVYMFKEDLFIPDDTLTVCCRIWAAQKWIPLPLSGRCVAETQIETESRSFIGTIENFSCLEPKEYYPFSGKQSTENFLSFMNLCVAADGKLQIEIKPAVSRSFSNYKCKIYILDVFGNKPKVGKGEFHDDESQYILLTLQKDQLTGKKLNFLPNNVLTIECEFTFSTGETTERIVDSEYGFDYDGSQDISYAMKTKLPTEEYYPESLTTLKDDLNSLFMEGILCDTKLKTATETFPVHKAVLSARSPVFKSMFTTDMRERTNNCVEIDDLDADTVRRMLKFMYLDTLDDLEYESAKSLYFAADKYSIVSLRNGCFNFLKQNILPSNCCGILLLADKHQDKYLKKAVQDCIARNDEEVLFSEEWKNLEKNHPQLTIEVFRAVYMKNRRS